jgi:hypothetical protein
VRASLGIYNTREDVDALLSGVRALAARPGDERVRSLAVLVGVAATVVTGLRRR